MGYLRRFLLRRQYMICMLILVHEQLTKGSNHGRTDRFCTMTEEDSCSAAKKSKTVTTDLSKGVLDLDEWNRRWAEEESHWHTSKIDPMLIKYEDKMFGGKEKCRVFVPLCGKSPDMKWMYDKGHTVIGVEIAPQGCREFFKESDISYKTEDHQNGPIFKSDDSRVILYAWDIFLVTKELVGEVDVIWDSRSLVALNREDLSEYAELLLSLMGPSTRQFLLTLEYEQSVHPGPPHSTPDSKVKELYESTCTIALVETSDFSPPDLSNLTAEELAERKQKEEEETKPYLGKVTLPGRIVLHNTCNIELVETIDKTAPIESTLTTRELEEKKRKEEEEMKPYLEKVVMPSRFNLRKSNYWYTHAYFIQRKKRSETEKK